MTKVAMITNRKLHTRTEINDNRERPLCPLLHNTCVFGAHHEILKYRAYTHVISRKMLSIDYSFWQYRPEDYPNIRRLFWSGGDGVVENGDFQCFRSLYLRNLYK